MLVSTAMLAFIVLGLTAMFVQTQKVFKTGIKQTTVTDAGRTIIDMIASDLSQMSDPHFTNVNGYPYFSPPNFPSPPTLNWAWSGLDLVQVVTNNGVPVYRTNELEDIFAMVQTNNTWVGVGYAVSNWFNNTNNGSPFPGVGTLYRYSTNITAPLTITNPPLINGFLSAINGTFINCHRIADGVVHLKIYAYDAGGNETQREWLADSGQISLQTFQYPVVVTNSTIPVTYQTNYLPRSIDIELGILEPEAFEHVRALYASGATAAAGQFLTNAAGQVEIFRQHIIIPSAQ
jgi:predicted transcriptional regulator with HTH domain